MEKPDQLMLLPASVLLAAKQRILIKGHATAPGTGPAGETCGSCAHLYRRQMAKVYHKCELNRAKWSGGGKTDVKVRDPACEKWAAPTAASATTR